MCTHALLYTEETEVVNIYYDISFFIRLDGNAWKKRRNQEEWESSSLYCRQTMKKCGSSTVILYVAVLVLFFVSQIKFSSITELFAVISTRMRDQGMSYKIGLSGNIKKASIYIKTYFSIQTFIQYFSFIKHP